MTLVQPWVNVGRLDLMGGEKRYNLRKEEMIAANIADIMVIYLFTILLITLLSPVGINDLLTELTWERLYSNDKTYFLL